MNMIGRKKENKLLAILDKTSNATCLREDVQEVIAYSFSRNQSRTIKSFFFFDNHREYIN